MDDVLQCVTLNTSGCNDLQMAALWSKLQTTSNKLHLPQECLEMLPSNQKPTFMTPVLECVSQFTDNLSVFVRNRASNGEITFILIFSLISLKKCYNCVCAFVSQDAKWLNKWFWQAFSLPISCTDTVGQYHTIL